MYTMVTIDNSDILKFVRRVDRLYFHTRKDGLLWNINQIDWGSEFMMYALMETSQGIFLPSFPTLSFFLS